MVLLVYLFRLVVVIANLQVLAAELNHHSLLRANESERTAVSDDHHRSSSHQRQQQFCTTCKFPKHSWDTFPVSFHSGRPDTHGPTGLEWLPEDLEALSRYPLITLEKWHGSLAFSTDRCKQSGKCDSPSNIFYWEQDAWVAAATQLKAQNPDISIAVW